MTAEREKERKEGREKERRERKNERKRERGRKDLKAREKAVLGVLRFPGYCSKMKF